MLKGRGARLSFHVMRVRVAAFGLVVVIAACDNKPKPIVIEAGPVATTPPLPPAPTQIDVLDAAVDVPDAAPDAAKPAVAVNVNQQRALRCCKALKDAAGNAPEFFALATTCTQFANSLGSGKGTATELEPLRQMLKGKKVPDLCAGL